MISNIIPWGFWYYIQPVQMNLKTVHLLLTQKDNSCLLNYRVPENRFCLINLILGIGKISSLNKKRWKSHCEYDSRTGTTVVYNTKRPFCPLMDSEKLPCAKQIHGFSFLSNKETASCSISLFFMLHKLCWNILKC